MTEGRDHRTGKAWTRLAAFGDSLMWGQGLGRNRRFSRRIAASLPKVGSTQQSPSLVYDGSRSGAQIHAHGNDRATFIDRFPTLSTSERSKRDFLDGTDEQPATGLYGEIRAPFPTITAQVALLPDNIGKTIDVALVDGGLNDLNPQDVINPGVSPGEFVERFDGLIRKYGHDDVLELIGLVRRKCPNAIILYFGFYAIFSYLTRTDRLRNLIKYETDDPIGWFLNSIFECRDVNEAILAAQTRGVWLAGRWQYWTRQAVVDANRDDTMRGPGVLFVPSGFGPENAANAPSESIFHRYRDPVDDPAQPVRRSNIPRIDHLKAMQHLYDKAKRGSELGSDEVRSLEAVLDGPSSLKAAMRAYADYGVVDDFRRMLASLRTDILRMRTDLVASAGHPNNQGAASYADNAIHRLARHRAVLEQISHEQQPSSITQGETLDAKLWRYKLRGPRPLAADVTNLDVDSLAVRTVTSAISHQNFFADIWLIVTTKDAAGRLGSRQYLLNFAYRLMGGYEEVSDENGVTRGVHTTWVVKQYPQFEPGTTSRFTVDTMGTLRLDEIMGCAIMVGDDPLKNETLPQGRGYGKVWRPEVVHLEVNGQHVAELVTTGHDYSFSSWLDLSYPSPHPNFIPPKLAPLGIKPVGQLGPFVNARRALVPMTAPFPTTEPQPSRTRSPG
jgi:hypothetical protein